LFIPDELLPLGPVTPSPTRPGGLAMLYPFLCHTSHANGSETVR
jgi:hypothetical protein